MAEYIPPNVNNLQICCISMNLASADLIRLTAFSPQMILVIRKAIKDGWEKSIQWEFDHYGIYDFKLNGYPWYTDDVAEPVFSRRLLVSILKAMATYGWNLSSAENMPKTEYEKHTMFFENAIPDPTCQIFSISLNMSDRILVIDAPEQIMPDVKQTVTAQWPKGIESEKEHLGALELKIKGNPWYSCDSDKESKTMYSRLILAQITINLKAIGFKLYPSRDLNPDYEDDAMDLYFRKVGPTWP